MKRPEIDWTAVTTVLTGIGVVAVLGPLQFSLSESTNRQLDDMHSDIRAMRSEIRAFRVEIGELRKEVAGEINSPPGAVDAPPP